MIIGIGCDVVEQTITQSLGWSSNLRARLRIFSEKELDIYEVQPDHRFLSGRFAAKEAVLKCFGTGMKDGIALTDIEILQTESGKPFIQTKGEVRKIANQLGITSWHISISHTNSNSTAFVVAEGTTSIATYAD